MELAYAFYQQPRTHGHKSSILIPIAKMSQHFTRHEIIKMVDMVNQNVIFSNENDSHMFIIITHEFP